MSHLKLTPSLWYVYNKCANSETEDWSEFQACLDLAPIPSTPAMQAGIDFENAVREWQRVARCSPLTNSVVGFPTPATDCARIVGDALYQQRVWREIIIDGQPYIVSGIIDWLGRDKVIDLKYTGWYQGGMDFILNKNIGHLAYTYCTDIDDFMYLISDGKKVYQEHYHVNDRARNAGALIEKVTPMLECIHRVPSFRDSYLTKWLCNPMDYEGKVLG